METGNLEEMSAADVLHRFADQSATGCLRFEHDGTEAQIWFRGGLVYTAAAPAARARLGDRLVGAGLITEEQLAEVLEHQRSLPERRRVGELMLDRGLIDREALRTYVHEQIADSVAVTLGWPSGRWQFDDGAETPEDTPLDISVENLLMEGVRRLQQWEVIQARIGSTDAIVDFAPSGSETQLSLTPDEWSMLTRIDGGSTIAEIAEEAGYGEFEAARIIYGLLVAGVVALVGDDDEAEAADDLAGDLTDDDADDAEPADDLAALFSEVGVDAAPPEAADRPDEPAWESRDDDLSEPERQPTPALEEEPVGAAAEEAPEPADPEEEEPEPAAAEEPEPTAAEEPEPADPREEEPEQRTPVSRNELMREFAALEEDWGVAPPPPPRPARPSDGSGTSDSGASEPPRPVPPPASRPAPPPESDRKRGLFGRRKKD